MRETIVTILALFLASCGGGGGGEEDASTDQPGDTPDAPEDTAADTAIDDGVAEVECSSDGDCDDGDPCTVDSCDMDDRTCASDPVDGDGDGYPAMEVEGTECAGGTDCDDGDPLTGLQECEGIDPCCDGCNSLGCWFDASTLYMWQNPPSTEYLDWDSAAEYCQFLPLAGVGLGEWHLPTIGELRTLLRGCPATGPAGACGVSDACLDIDTCAGSCDACTAWTGPGTGGCYRDAALGGDCGGVEWSSSTCTGSGCPGGASAWMVGFANASIGILDKTTSTTVRCVHTP